MATGVGKGSDAGPRDPVGSMHPRKPPRTAQRRTPGKRPRRVSAGRSVDHRRMHETKWSRSDAERLLDTPARRISQDPDRLWRRLGLKAGDIVVDVGSGSGFYAFPAAARVGREGRVFAVDISAQLVELVRERATEQKVRNLDAVLSTPTHIPIEDAIADVALLADVLHGIPRATVGEAVRLVRPGGRLVNVDWKKKATPEGPSVKHRLSTREAAAALAAFGLTRVDSFDLGPYHYVLVFERPRPPRLPGRLVSAE